MPDKARSGNLLIKARSGLKDYSIGKNNDSARWLTVRLRAANFHEVQADEANINYIAGYARDLNAIAHPDPVFADQEEIPCYCHDHILQRHGNPGGNQSGKGRDGADLCSQGKSYSDANCAPQNNAAQQQKLVAAAGIMNIAKYRAPPNMGQSDHYYNHDSEDHQPDQQAAQISGVTDPGHCTPASKIAFVQITQH